MTKGSDFENPLEKAVQLGTIGTKTKPAEETTPQAQKHQVRKPARHHAAPSPLVGKSASDKPLDRKQQTIYLPIHLTRTLKHHAVDLDSDISSVVQTALEEYFDRHSIPF